MKTVRKLVVSFTAGMIVFLFVGILCLFVVLELVRNSSEAYSVSVNNEERYEFSGEKYNCVGSCYCDSNRRSATTMTKPLLFAVTSLSLVLAIQLSREYFQTQCRVEFSESCPDGNLFSELNTCSDDSGQMYFGGDEDIFGSVPGGIAGILKDAEERSKEKEKLVEEDRKMLAEIEEEGFEEVEKDEDILVYTCGGYCIEKKRKREFVWIAKEIDCEKLTLHDIEITVRRDRTNSLAAPKKARIIFRRDYLGDFCKVNSANLVRYHVTSKYVLKSGEVKQYENKGRQEKVNWCAAQRKGIENLYCRLTQQ